MPESWNPFKKVRKPQPNIDSKTHTVSTNVPSKPYEPLKKKVRLSRLEKIKIAFNLMKFNHSHERENARRARQIEKGMIKLYPSGIEGYHQMHPNG